MTTIDPKHLDALVERQRQIAILHRGIIQSRKDTIRGPLSLSEAEHRELIADASRAADGITALRAQIDRERAATIEAAAKAINDRGAEEQRNFGLGRETQNFYRARDIVRALHTDATRAAMDAIRREAREQALREAAVVCVSLRKEEGRPEDECIGCMDCASAILALADSGPPNPDINAASRQQTAPKTPADMAFRFDGRIEWRGHDDARLIFAVSPTGEWVRAADHDIIVADLQTLLARVLVMDLGSAEEAAEALGGLPEAIRLVETHHAAHPRPGNPDSSPDPDEVEF